MRSASILRLKNILTAFDDFAGNEVLSEREFQDYQSLYLNLYAEFRAAAQAEKESIVDDVVFEVELIKQVEINVDYILMLVERYLKAKGADEVREIRVSIERAGTAITRILPPVSRFSRDGGHALKKQAVLDRLAAYFERFFGLGDK